MRHRKEEPTDASRPPAETKCESDGDGGCIHDDVPDSQNVNVYNPEKDPPKEENVEGIDASQEPTEPLEEINVTDPPEEINVTEPPQKTTEQPTQEEESFDNAGEDCVPDELGRYGSNVGAAAEQQVDYWYQVELQPHITYTVLTGEILPQIERQASLVMLSVVFSDDCGERRRLLAWGLSAEPPDQIAWNDSCKGSLRSNNNSCIVVAGVATVYTRDSLNPETSTQARMALFASMADGNFDQVHDGIVSVKSWSDNDAPAGVQSAPRSEANGEGSTGVPAWAWAVLAVGLVASLVMALVVMKRQRRNQLRYGNFHLGIFPRTRQDDDEGDFPTKSSWDVLQTSPKKSPQSLGISERELVDSPRDFDVSTPSSWNVLPPSTPERNTVGISTRMEDSNFTQLVATTSSLHLT